MPFDLERAWLKGPNLFQRFDAPVEGVPLADAALRDGTLLLIAERGGEARAFLVRQMSYHHVAQGTLAGEPYLVTF